MKEEFLKKLAESGINLSNEQLVKLDFFAQELAEKNKILNLISSGDLNCLYKRHLLDSLFFLAMPKEILAPDKTGLKIADIGSGGGFPAVPLAIAMPETSFTLYEAVRKKYLFLLHSANKLGLRNLRAENRRIEKNEVSAAGLFDIVTERAMAKPQEAVPLCLLLTKPGGAAIIWQNRENEAEIEKTKKPDFIYNYSVGEKKRERALFVFLKKSEV